MPTTPTKFTHLHVHSHYSLLDGLAKIDDIVNRTKELGMDAIALTDHGVLYGAIEFYKKAKAAGIKPILGCETYVAPKSRFSKEPGERYYHLILLAKNNTGWQNLIKLITKSHLEGFYYKPRIDKEILREHAEGLIGLSACLGGEVDRALLDGNFLRAKEVALEYESIFGKGNYYLELQKHPHIADSEKIESDIVRLSKETGVPLVATQDLHYAKPEDAEYHDVLLAVQTGNKMADDDRLSMKEDDFSLTPPEVVREKLKDFPEAVENTAKIADMCNVELALGKTILPDFPKPEGKNADQYLRELIDERLARRFPSEAQTEAVKSRIEYELSVIEKTGFADYFLIVQDLVNWAKSHGIAVGPGRGSAAGSIVSYILGITDIDPLRYQLLFERFLNPERIQTPDIDMDFADTRREEVLAYAREKYGIDHVAQIITFGTMAARAAIRDVGRAMGLTYAFCDQIAKLIPFNTNLKDSLEKVPELAEMHKTNADAKRVLDAAEHLEGVARHASVHACATVISKEPLTNYLPLQLAPQDRDIIITQFEMHAVEDLGLLKMDFLGLRNLTVIEEAVKLIKELKGTDIKLEELPMDDKKTFALLQEANTTGVFQLESSGMRRYLKELKPTEFEDIVVMVALFRPGPMELIPTYIKRKHGQEKVRYIHPAVEAATKNTYGVIVYQEQVMDMATDLAGLTRGEGYVLIKAVGKKIKKLLDEQKDKFINGCLKRNVPQQIAEKTWELIEPFAHYGFNKAHSACYAMTAYRTAYLKANYPEEFMAALLNSEMNDIERIAVLIEEAKQNKIEVLPPDINKSFVSFTPEGSHIRFGLLAIKNVGSEITKSIIEERLKNGPYKNFEDLLTRITHKDMNKKSLESLIKSGALDSLGIERNQALANLDEALKLNNAIKRGAAQFSQAASLFGASAPLAAPKLILKPAAPASANEKLAWEKELIGFYLSDHPLRQYKTQLERALARPIDELYRIKNEKLTIRTAGVVTKIHNIFTKKGDPMVFVTIGDETPKPIEVVVFTSILQKTQSVWLENELILIEGKVSWRDDEPKVICDRARKLSDLPQPPTSQLIEVQSV